MKNLQGDSSHPTPGVEQITRRPLSVTSNGWVSALGAEQYRLLKVIAGIILFLGAPVMGFWRPDRAIAGGQKTAAWQG